MQLSYRFGFDAAHHFDDFPAGHPYRGMHGHSFQVEIAVAGQPDPASGFVLDFAAIEAAALEVRGVLDHRVLNEIEGLSRPSLENLCLWIWNALAPRLPAFASVAVRRDSCGQGCTYTGPAGR